MREKPSEAEVNNWNEFELWADSQGIGTHVDDWSPWWYCWKVSSAVTRGKLRSKQ